MSDKLQAERKLSERLRFHAHKEARPFMHLLMNEAADELDRLALSSSQQDKALQSLADQAQELDMGYGPNACPSCGKSSQEQPSSVAMTDNHPAWTRPVLYTDTLNGEQTRRDDLWAITTEELQVILQSSPKGASTGMEMEESIEKFIHVLRGFAQAYPEDVFIPLTPEETKEYSIIVTRASAGMGRHLAKVFVQAADMIERLSPLSSPQKASKPQDDDKIACSDCGLTMGQSRMLAAASGRELPPLPQSAAVADVRNKFVSRFEKIPHRTHLYTADQMRERDAMWMERIAALAGAAPADANVGIPEALQKAIRSAISLLWEIPANAPNTLGLRAYDIAGELKTLLVNANKPTTTAPEPSAPADKVHFDFIAHLARQAAWSEKTFGPGARTAGVCDHIRKELLEIEADPLDLKEWIDVVILALDGAWRCGGSPDQIIDGIVAKQTKNEGRIWPDWRTADPNKAIEHDRSQDAAIARMRSESGKGGKL